MIMENKTNRIRAIFLLYQQLYKKGTLNFSIHQEGRIKKGLFPSPKNLNFMITMEVQILLAVVRTKKEKR